MFKGISFTCLQSLLRHAQTCGKRIPREQKIKIKENFLCVKYGWNLFVFFFKLKQILQWIERRSIVIQPLAKWTQFKQCLNAMANRVTRNAL